MPKPRAPRPKLQPSPLAQVHLSYTSNTPQEQNADQFPFPNPPSPYMQSRSQTPTSRSQTPTRTPRPALSLSTNGQQQEMGPEMGLVRDPAFWKRFSVAVHRAEDWDKELGTPVSSVSGETGNGDEWLTQQHKDKRRCRCLCVSITLAILVVAAAGAVVGWYFVHNR